MKLIGYITKDNIYTNFSDEDDFYNPDDYDDGDNFYISDDYDDDRQQESDFIYLMKII